MSLYTEQLGALARAKPFIPFCVHLVDGRSLEVTESAQLFGGGDPEDEIFTIHKLSADGEFDEVEILTTRSIVSLSVRVKLK